MARLGYKCVLCEEREATVPSTDTCHNCYNAVLRWSKRDQGDVMHRAFQIGLYAKRMMIVGNGTTSEILRPKKIRLKAMPGKIKLKEHNRLKGKYKNPPKKL